MPALNRVQLIGYLGKDPETRADIHRQESDQLQHRRQPPLARG